MASKTDTGALRRIEGDIERLLGELASVRQRMGARGKSGRTRAMGAMIDPVHASRTQPATKPYGIEGSVTESAHSVRVEATMPPPDRADASERAERSSTPVSSESVPTRRERFSDAGRYEHVYELTRKRSSRRGTR